MDINLFDYEKKFSLEKEKKATPTLSDEEINEKYKKGEIRIVTEQGRYPLDSITAMVASLKYDLNPEYQRRKRWNNSQKSKLIESFIINVPIPPIFIYEVNFDKYEVMDGLQRLSAINEFYLNEYPLKDLEQWTELNGKYYKDLPENIKHGINRRYLSSIVLLTETARNEEEAERLKQMVFERLNTGGDKLTAQETRNALYKGIFNKFCIDLSKDDNFRNLWNYPLYSDSEQLESNEAYRKMEDVELVLRFFAYRHIEKLTGSQEDFLDKYLQYANNYKEEELEELKNIFLETMEFAYKLMEDKCLYMPATSTQIKTTPTKTIYDALMQVLSNYLDKKTAILNAKEKFNDILYANKDDLKYPAPRTMGEEKFNDVFDGKYNSKQDVMRRMEYFDKKIQEVLNDI